MNKVVKISASKTVNRTGQVYLFDGHESSRHKCWGGEKRGCTLSTRPGMTSFNQDEKVMIESAI